MHSLVQVLLVLQCLGVTLSANPSCFPTNINCDENQKYQSYDGSCNNLFQPYLGMAGMPYARLFPNKYRDGNQLPPNNLPNARLVRTTLFPNLKSEDRDTTQLWMQWGQLIAHDVMITMDNAILNCCNNKNNISNFDDVCIPIQVPREDAFYSKLGVTCLNLVRHANSFLNNCGSFAAAQINSVTHFLDSSDIYGSSKQTADSLRTFRGGQLKTSFINGMEYLPFAENDNVCVRSSSTDKCFRSGDIRVNQTPNLMVLTTTMYIIHNKLARGLAEQNPAWDDERIFQEARKIVIAIRQHLTYKYWLAPLIGERYMVDREMFPKSQGCSNYNSSVNPSTLNEFAASTYRNLHSTIQATFALIDEDGQYRFDDISRHFNNPHTVQQGNNYDELLRGMTGQKCRRFSRFFNSELTNELFKGNKTFGTDLVSIDIQRGRDHGLGSYAQALSCLFKKRVRSFNDLTDLIEPRLVQALKALYREAKDVDLYVGTLLEKVAQGTRIGLTGRIIIAEQFYRYMFGDRAFYQHCGQFTSEQLHEIRKYTVGRFMCDGLHVRPQVVRRNPFLIHSELVECRELPPIDLSKWRDF